MKNLYRGLHIFDNWHGMTIFLLTRTILSFDFYNIFDDWILLYLLLL